MLHSRVFSNTQAAPGTRVCAQCLCMCELVVIKLSQGAHKPLPWTIGTGNINDKLIISDYDISPKEILPCIFYSSGQVNYQAIMNHFHKLENLGW